MILAKVIKSGKREFECRLQADGKVVTAGATGNILKSDESIVVGDIVRLEQGKQGAYQIVAVGERTSEIHRILVREGKRKVMAANVDCIVVITSASLPPYKRGLLDRFLVRAAQWNLPCLVVFNKMDEYDGKEFDVHFEADRLGTLDIQCFEISAKYPEFQKRYLSMGREDLRQALKGKTSIFMGHSGVGKSKTINMLTGGAFSLRTQEIGKSGKGTHTTTWSEIIDCGEFGLIDSPGIRSFSLDDVDPEELRGCFPDLAAYFGKCKFADCLHEEQAKGCAFASVRQDPSREAQLLLSRLESYQRIYEEISALPHWKKKAY